jgi:hypothetical protein
VLDLKHARDSLKQYQKKTEARWDCYAFLSSFTSHPTTQPSMTRHTEIARQLLKQGNKKAALVVLKKKKLGMMDMLCVTPIC